MIRDLRAGNIRGEHQSKALVKGSIRGTLRGTFGPCPEATARLNVRYHHKREGERVISRKKKGAPVVIVRKDKRLNKAGHLLAFAASGGTSSVYTAARARQQRQV